LSAFFSGSETGFYRVTRVRLVIDAMEGDWLSWSLLQLTNHPALFVATTLIGNNLANYLTSLAVVLITKGLAQSDAALTELIATIAFSPLVFVYGELLPKYLFFNSPNFLLRRSAPLFVMFTVLFAPISALLWLLGLALQTLAGETPLRVKPELARKELKDMLRESQEVGVLQPSQRRLAQDVFDIGGRPVSQFCRPASRVVSVPIGTEKNAVQAATSKRSDTVLVVHEPDSKKWIGYHRVVDLHLARDETIDRGQALIELNKDDSLVHAMIQLQSQKEELAQVIDQQNRPVGLLYASDVNDLLMRHRESRFASARRRRSTRTAKSAAKKLASGSRDP
jgi:CBS domain containing-hemolysin-like protein